MFVVSDEDDVDGMQDAGVALVRAYNYIRDESDSQSAFEAVISVNPPWGEKNFQKTSRIYTLAFCVSLFLHKMFNQIPLGGTLSVLNVVKVLEKSFPYVEVSSILGVDSSYDTNRKVSGVEPKEVASQDASSSSAHHPTSPTSPLFLALPQEASAYYKQTGMGPLPVVMYNGIPYQREQLDPDELETVTMQKILETTTFYQRAVYLVSRGKS